MQQQAEAWSAATSVFEQDAVWQSLVQAGTAEELTQAWLVVLCSLVKNVRAGLLLLEDAEGSFTPVSVWPSQMDLRHLAPTAEQALMQRKGIVNQETGETPRLGYPLLASGHLHGAVVLELQEPNEATITQAMRITHWGVGWLVDVFNRRQLSQLQAQLQRSAFLFDVILAEFGDTDYHQASLAVVNKLAEHFQCHQVQLGVENGKSIDILAVSHSAWFDQKSQWISLAASAMNEAYDQRTLMRWPVDEDGPLLIYDAHRRYANETASPCLCSVPLESGIKLIGVLMLERDIPFTPVEVDFLETLALTLAPVLALKKERQESLLSHAKRTFLHWWQQMMGAAYPGVKLIIITLALLLILTGLIHQDFRVSSPAVVEGAVQRAVVAPFDGFIREAPVRAGDVVQLGQLLLKLEDKDLLLDKSRWEAELEVALRKERDAMAKADRVNQRQASAQADQARAQLNLSQEKLSRVTLTAPFAGVIVKGDLSQKLGSPVKQGDVQFELAPLDAWRVILKVDERDIAYVAIGQSGELILTSLPAQVRPFKVEKITPVALAEEGRNYFRVEAKLSEESSEIRPNMEGVGKITTDQRSLLWIGTHRFFEWLCLTIWELLP